MQSYEKWFHQLYLMKNSISAFLSFYLFYSFVLFRDRFFFLLEVEKVRQVVKRMAYKRHCHICLLFKWNSAYYWAARAFTLFLSPFNMS